MYFLTSLAVKIRGENKFLEKKRMPFIFANWTAIGLTYLVVLIAILLTLVLVATYFTWNKAKPLPTSSTSSTSNTDDGEADEQDIQEQTTTSPVPPIVSAYQPIRANFFDDEEDVDFKEEDEKEKEDNAEKEDEKKKEKPSDLAKEIQRYQSNNGVNEERPLPLSQLVTQKTPGTVHKFFVSQRTLLHISDYHHPGFIVMYHPRCTNPQAAHHQLTEQLGTELTAQVTRTHYGSLGRWFHVKSLSDKLKRQLLEHPLVGDIYEDGWLSLNLPPHNSNESASEKETKVQKLKLLAKHQIVPWSVVRVGGKTSSLNIGSKQTRALLVYQRIAVFVMDSGIDTNHPELVQGIWSRNFISSYEATWISDEHGHGTHVAGIIGAQDNSMGTVGTCPGVPIHAIKVLDRNGVGSLSSVLEGLNYVYELATKHADTRCLMNLSFGMSDVSELLDHYIIKVSEKVSIIMAAGNEREDVNKSSPARTALQHDTITVGAFDQHNAFSSYSNFGQGLTVLAPGDNILSTFKNSSFAYLSGTSMAASCVTGVLAAYLSTLALDQQRNETSKSLKQKLHAWSTQATAQESQLVSNRPGAYTCSRSVFMKF